MLYMITYIHIHKHRDFPTTAILASPEAVQGVGRPAIVAVVQPQLQEIPSNSSVLLENYCSRWNVP